MREKMLEDTKDSLINYVDHINTVLEEAAGTQHPEERERLDAILSTLDIHPSAKYPYLSLSLSDYGDLASLALQYGLHTVHMAVSQIYNKYILQNHPVDKIGALARTIIRNRSIYSAAS